MGMIFNGVAYPEAHSSRESDGAWQSVELRELRVFLRLCEDLHFANAAEGLTLSASRVSQMIRTLETRVGGRLFDRTSRRVRLTPLGSQLRQAIASAYCELESGFAATREAAIGLAGEVRLGMYTPSNGGHHLLEIVKVFQDRHRRCRVALVDTGFAREQVDWLRRGDVDLLAMRLPFLAPDVTIGPILSCEDRVVAVSAAHPLATRDSVTLEDLADCAVPEVRSLPTELEEDTVPSHTPLGRVFARVPTHTPCEALMRVATGEIVYPTVGSFVDHFRHPHVTALPLRGMPPLATALVWLTAGRNRKVDAFVDAATGVLEFAREPRE